MVHHKVLPSMRQITSRFILQVSSRKQESLYETLLLGDKRVASRIGTGLFNNVYGRNGSYVTAGQQDYAERMNQIQKQKEAYYKQQGIAPGVPTMKGAYGDPENTGVGYNTVITELGDHSVPEGWIQTPKHNTTEGNEPGAPISWNDPTNPENPQPGYGYVDNDTTKEETFFYHSDHLGSTSYITDSKGNITQYDAYCRTVNCLLMNIVVVRICRISSMARRWMQKLACTTMVQGT